MMDKDLIVKLAEEKLEGSDRFIVDIQVKTGNVINVTIDSDSSISIDDCIKISRNIEFNLDRETEDFSLNVSSAGLDQPFKLLRQYQKYIGKEVSVLLNTGKKVNGNLLTVNDEKLSIEIPANKKKKTEKSEAEFLLEEIKETKSIISFKK
jgi:ribosome maturation factor RimP